MLVTQILSDRDVDNIVTVQMLLNFVLCPLVCGLPDLHISDQLFVTEDVPSSFEEALVVDLFVGLELRLELHCIVIIGL